MEDFITNITKKLFSLIISLGILWIVIQIALSGYNHINNKLSGQELKENIFKEYSTNLKSLINTKELEDSDILKITNYYNRKANNKFKEIGYATILEDYYVLSINETNESEIFLKNKEKINNLIMILKKDEPYANLPQKERIALKNFDLSIKAKDIERIKADFRDLEQILEQRYSEYKRIEKESENNKIISYISILIGLISIIIPSVGIKKFISFFKKETTDTTSPKKDIDITK